MCEKDYENKTVCETLGVVVGCVCACSCGETDCVRFCVSLREFCVSVRETVCVCLERWAPCVRMRLGGESAYIRNRDYAYKRNTVCACVCVCEREREREILGRGVRDLR